MADVVGVLTSGYQTSQRIVVLVPLAFGKVCTQSRVHNTRPGARHGAKLFQAGGWLARLARRSGWRHVASRHLLAAGGLVGYRVARTVQTANR